MATISELVVKLELQQAAFNKGMEQAARQLARVQQAARSTQSGMSGLENSLKGVATAAAAVGAAFALVKGIGAIATASDQLKRLQGSFAALLGDGDRAADMMQRVFGIVERTGTPLEAVAGGMQRLTIALSNLGASNRQIETITETFAQLAKVGGSSAAETANSLQQLGQALASGKLGGDELKSIRENAPLVADAIAKAIGVTSGELKQLGEDGKLTSDVVANALLKASEKAGAAFAKLPQGFEQATNKMEAQATAAAAAFDKIGGTTTTLVTVTDHIAANLKRWSTELADTNKELNSTQILAQSVNDVFKLLAVGAVAIGFAWEQIVKRTAFWAEQLKLLVELDWSGMVRSSERFNAQMEASAEAAERTIRALLGMQQASQGQTGETGGFPVIPPRPLKPPPGGGGGGGKGGKSDIEREAEALKKRGEALAASVDPLNAYNQKLAEYTELLNKAAISDVTFARAVEKAKEELTAAGDALTASVDPAFAYELAMRKINQAYRDGAIEVETWIKLQEKAKEEMKDAQGQSKKSQLAQLSEDAAEAIGGGIGDFFENIVDGSMTAQEAFNQMVKSIIADLGRLLAEFAAKEAAKFIIKSLFGGTASASGASASMATLAAVPTWNAAGSLAGGFGSSRGARAGGGAEAGMTAGTTGGPWQVTINNNAAGVDVRTAQRGDGGLEVTVERVRAQLTQDVARGGNPFSRTLESAYSLGRGR